VRLTEIRLSGFKSFVDPTHIRLPGQIVGVVGPNGCGKSNVIDATRWVLGESSARHLRGETMQDVIFSGSATRNPANRASVELIFDNSLGKAGGQWASYAELSVKRVLERDGESAYYINNAHVRRRDVADVFLGTGLGGRGYAIIEQGTISRIIDAKPEELRVFLEEAAGVSRYRERRRETENRLSDARQNLARVDDIRLELERQIERLTAQAAVAAQFQELTGSLTAAQNLLWYLRRGEASAQRERQQREVERLSIELETETARLREIEKRLTETRDGQQVANETARVAQGELYEANAEVARLEQQITYLRDTRARVEAQLEQARARHAQMKSQHDTGLASLEQWRSEAQTAQVQAESARANANHEAGLLPQAEAAAADAQARVTEAERALAQAEQLWQVEETRRGSSQRLIEQLGQRGERLAAERSGLALPDRQAINLLQGALTTLGSELTEMMSGAAGAEQRLAQGEAASRDARAAVDAAGRELTQVQARRDALEQLQSRLANAQATRDWAARHGLSNARRLWQGLRIEDGWENALEAVLRERLNAFAVERIDAGANWLGEMPGAKVAVYELEAGVATTGSLGVLGRPLRELVTCDDTRTAPVLADWLSQVFVAASLADGLRLRERLPAGATLVTREGHLLSRSSVVFYAPDSEVHGVLSRQREIESLAAQIEALSARLAQARERDVEATEAVAGARRELSEKRRLADELRQNQHSTQMQFVRQTEQADRVEQRIAQIDREAAEVGAEHSAEVERLAATDVNLERFAAQLQSIGAQLAATRAEAGGAQGALGRAREAAQQAAQQAQQAQFRVESARTRIGEGETALAAAGRELDALNTEVERLGAEVGQFDDAPLQASLQQALATRQTRETAMAAARNALSELETRLRAIDEERLGSEQKHEPLRTAISEAKLKEQEARLTEEQFAAKLTDAAADETALAKQAEDGPRPRTLAGEINRLQAEIAALGAVNLAALEELGGATEKKNVLDAQANDLNEAITTLETAIRRIDRETRERLMATFDEANKHLAEMFPALFGGGQAQLVLTGEEILDSGVQIFAHPPGKKNASIQLLSGGEKALTALSLVFSLFQLNPAPFCLLDEVDAPLDDTNTERFRNLLQKMSAHTQFLFISHNKITMEGAQQLIGVTMQEQGVSRVVAVDIDQAMRMTEEKAA
jgi:chromosome segregation protein